MTLQFPNNEFFYYLNAFSSRVTTPHLRTDSCWRLRSPADLNSSSRSWCRGFPSSTRDWMSGLRPRGTDCGGERERF